MADAPRDNRVPIMFSGKELQSIDDWRFAKRVGTRAGAVRRLIQIGLAFSEVADEMENLSSDLMQFDPKAAFFWGDTPLPPGSKEHLQKQWEFIGQFMQVYEFARELSKDGDLEKLQAEAQEARDYWRKPGDEGDSK